MPQTYLPSIHSNTPIQTQGETPVELFTVLWMQTMGERAGEMRQDERLMRAASLHADYLDSRRGDELLQNMHVGRNGTTPNQRVREQGYALPGWYPVAANQVECCVRCSDDATWALQLLLASPSHRPMMLREDWFTNHTVYGIGFCGADWSVLACPPETSTP